MPGTQQTQFTRYFVVAVLFRGALFIGAMLLSFAGAAVGRQGGGSAGGFYGALAGLVVGFVLAAAVKRRWDPLDRVPDPD